jgi:hypothetical protein
VTEWRNALRFSALRCLLIGKYARLAPVPLSTRQTRQGKAPHRNFYGVKIRNARGEKKPADEIDKLVRAVISEIDEVEDRIAELQSDRLITTAERLGVPVPPYHDVDQRWRVLVHTDRLILSVTAMQELRSAIRTERKEHSELVRSWLASIAGIIGAARGLSAFSSGSLQSLGGTSQYWEVYKIEANI